MTNEFISHLKVEVAKIEMMFWGREIPEDIKPTFEWACWAIDSTELHGEIEFGYEICKEFRYLREDGLLN